MVSKDQLGTTTTTTTTTTFSSSNIATWVCDIWLLCTFFLRVSNVGVQGLLPVPLP